MGAQLSLPFAVTIDIPGNDKRSAARSTRPLQVHARRKQLPLTISTSATLYTMQGTTTGPGPIYHFRTPRRLSRSLKWRSTCMALSRVRCLEEFRSIGIKVRMRSRNAKSRRIPKRCQKQTQSESARECAETPNGRLRCVRLHAVLHYSVS